MESTHDASAPAAAPPAENPAATTTAPDTTTNAAPVQSPGPQANRRWPLQKRYVIPFLVVQFILVIVCAVNGWGWFALSIIDENQAYLEEDNSSYYNSYDTGYSGYNGVYYGANPGYYQLQAAISFVNAFFATVNLGLVVFELVQFCRAKLSAKTYFIVRSLAAGCWILQCIFCWFNIWAVVLNVGSFVLAGVGEWIYSLVLFNRERHARRRNGPSTDGFGGYSAPPMMAAGQGGFVPGQYYYPYAQPAMMAAPVAPMAAPGHATREFYAPQAVQPPPSVMTYGGYRYTLTDPNARPIDPANSSQVALSQAAQPSSSKQPLQPPTSSHRGRSQDGVSDVSASDNIGQAVSHPREAV